MPDWLFFFCLSQELLLLRICWATFEKLSLPCNCCCWSDTSLHWRPCELIEWWFLLELLECRFWLPIPMWFLTLRPSLITDSNLLIMFDLELRMLALLFGSKVVLLPDLYFWWITSPLTIFLVLKLMLLNWARFLSRPFIRSETSRVKHDLSFTFSYTVSRLKS